MSKKPVIKALENFGLTKMEAEAYVLLAKHGVLKGGEITRQMNRNKGQVYRILNSLQEKGLVETTLESPKRFIAIPFEKALEMFVKRKRDELTKIEKKTKDLLSDWEKISQTTVEQSLEKFLVIEGSKKIFQKISEMIKQTQNNLFVIFTVQDLVRGEQFGIFDFIYSNPLKSRIEYRFLTEINEQNLKGFRLLKAKLRDPITIKASDPAGAMFPRIIIRDNSELLLFLSRKIGRPKRSKEVCVHTNSESLVQAFTKIFEDFWSNSINVENRIAEIETGEPTPKTQVIKDEKNAEKKYNQIIRNAEKEIILMAPKTELIKLSEKIPYLVKNENPKISVKIVTPVTNENLECAKSLTECCEVRHFPATYFATAIIDDKHLFRFKGVSLETEEFSFKNTFYTTDSTYVEKSKKRAKTIWQYAASIPKSRSKPSMEPQKKGIERRNLVRDKKELIKRFLQKGGTHLGTMTSIAGVIEITPPGNLEIPNLKINALHIIEGSRHIEKKRGSSDLLRIDMWLETPKGEKWIPVALVLDAGPDIVSQEKKKWAGTLVEQNIISVKPEELQVWMEEKILFAGWTIPIPLLGGKYTLDPAIILFEAYGEKISSISSFPLPSGYLMGFEWEGFPAFTNFIGPSWKYSGPGTSGLVGNLTVVNIAPKTA